MDIIRKLLKKKHKTLIAVDNGIGIRGMIIEDSGICTDHSFPAGTGLKKILEFGREQHAGCVVLLQTADLRELEVRLGADLSSDERRSAIEYAASGNPEDAQADQRISYMDGMFHDFRSGILVSYFDTDEVVSVSNLVKSMKMKFLGITNFKQLLLAQHFSDPDHHGDAFLFLLGNHGVAAVPERSRLLIRNLPFGLPENGMEDEWKERAQRRLAAVFRNKRVCLYTPEADERLCAMLDEICGAELIETVNWDDAVSAGAVFMLKKGCQLIHPALPPPKAADPKASGTYTGLFFLALTVLSLGFLIVRNCITGYSFKRDIEINQKKTDTVKQETDALKNLETQLVEQQQIFSVLKQQQRVSRNYLLVLNLLARYPLQYSKITAVEERAAGIFITGESVWQPDLSRFFTHFEGELSKYDLTLFSDGLSKEKDGKIIFRSHVATSGGTAK